MLNKTVRFIVQILSIPDEELFSETAVGCTASYFCQNNMMLPLVLFPLLILRLFNCFICGRQRVAVARYRMICLVLSKLGIFLPTVHRATNLLKILVPGFKSSLTITTAFTNITCNEKEKNVYMMDPSHVFKKIRNNLYKSDTYPDSKRCILLHGKSIIWDHLKNAYTWDITSHPFPIYHRLTDEHFHLTSDNKIRNHLAEQVLISEMLHLLCEFKKKSR